MDHKLKELEDNNKEIEQKLESNELEPLDSKNDKTTNDTKTKEKLTITQRLKLIKETTTLEPIMLCYVMPSVLASFTVQNLNVEKACRVNLNYSAEVCHALYLRQTENYTYFEQEVQKLTASVQAWKNVIQTVIPLFLIMFVGAWSDKTGKRKPCILLPIVGELLASLGFIVNTYYFYELPVEVTALTESIFPAITGGWVINFIGCYSYIVDITTEEDRTFRVGIVNLCATLGVPLGTALSAFLLSWVGYYGVFTITSCLYSFGLIYGFFYLVDSKKEIQRENEKRKNCIGHLIEFFDVRLVADTFKVIFGKEAANIRLRISLLMLVVFVIYGPFSGENTVMYLFTRYRFNWNEVQYCIWQTYSMVTGLIAPLLEILIGMLSIALRFIIGTKLVSGKEIGKVNSLFGLAEAMTPLVYGPLYSRVYMATLNILPGAFFLVGILLYVPAVAILGWLFIEERKEKKNCSEKDIEK